MGIHPHGCLGDAKAHRRNIIVYNAEKFKIMSHLRTKMLRMLPLGMG